MNMKRLTWHFILKNELRRLTNIKNILLSKIPLTKSDKLFNFIAFDISSTQASVQDPISRWTFLNYMFA